MLCCYLYISGIQVTNKYQSFVSATQVRRKDGSAISSIIIRRVSTKHTGTYSCRPANLEPAQIKLHVIRGKFDYHFLSLSFNQKLSNERTNRFLYQHHRYLLLKLLELCKLNQLIQYQSCRTHRNVLAILVHGK